MPSPYGLRKIPPKQKQKKCTIPTTTTPPRYRDASTRVRFPPVGETQSERQTQTEREGERQRQTTADTSTVTHSLACASEPGLCIIWAHTMYAKGYAAVRLHNYDFVHDSLRTGDNTCWARTCVIAAARTHARTHILPHIFVRQTCVRVCV